MLIAAIVFALMLGVIIGPYWAFVLRPEDQEDRALRKRMRVQKVLTGGSVARGEGRRSAITPLNTALGRLTKPTDSLERLVARSGVSVNAGTVVLLSVFLAVTTAALLTWVQPSVPAALALGAVAACMPVLYLRRAAGKRFALFEEQFPEAVDLMARALRAGHALTTSLQMVADEVPDPVSAEFKMLFDQQNYGMSLPDALKAFAARMPILDARFFVTALLTQRETGGNLAEVLDNLASVVRERFKVKRQVRVISAHGRITGWVLGLLPPILAVVLFLISPDHMRLLLDDPIGVQMAIGGIGLQIIGLYFIRRIVDVEY